MAEQEQTAIIPITEVLPELRDEQYAKVCEWDAARMALAGEYEAADGEYLKKIRDELKAAGHGLWTRYLEARGIPDSTARRRIQVADGRFTRTKPLSDSGLRNQSVIPSPVDVSESDMVMIPTSEYQELKHRERLGGMYAAEKGYLKSQQDYRNGDLPVEPEPPAVSPTYGAMWDDGDEWATDARTPRGTPLSAYIPKVTPPTNVPRDALPTTPQQWEHRLDEIARETPEQQELPVVRFISALYAINHISDANIAAWLAIATPDDLHGGADIFRRIEQFAANMQEKIKGHQRSGLRLVND